MLDIFQKVTELLKDNQTVALVTVISARGSTPRHTGAKMIVLSDGRTWGTVGGGPVEAAAVQDARQAIQEGSSRVFRYELDKNKPGGLHMNCGGTTELFVEVIPPPPRLIILGAGHIGAPLAAMGSMLDFEVTVVDPRPEFAREDRFPAGVRVVRAGYVDAFDGQVTLNSSSYVVILTPDSDEPALERAVRSEARYIGMVGSRRKVAVIFRNLEEKGIDPAMLKRVHAPIGLDIQAETPAEIAVSIIAEIIMARNGGTGRMLSASREA